MKNIYQLFSNALLKAIKRHKLVGSIMGKEFINLVTFENNHTT